MDTFPPKNRQETGRSRKKTRKKRENPDPRPYVWHRIIRICTTFAATAALPHSRIMCFYRDSVIRVLPSFGFTILILPYRPADKKNLYVFMLCRYADKKKKKRKAERKRRKNKETALYSALGFRFLADNDFCVELAVGQWGFAADKRFLLSLWRMAAWIGGRSDGESGENPGKMGFRFGYWIRIFDGVMAV